MIDFARTDSEDRPERPADEHDFARLRTNIDWAYSQLEPFRKVNKRLIDAYVGGSYYGGEQTTRGSRPLNLHELAVNTYQRKLASHTPQVLVSTTALALKPTAAELELLVNHVISHELDLGTRLNEYVINALFSIGIMKVGRSGPIQPRPLGYNTPQVNVYAEIIQLADWVHDVSASRLEDVEYCGHIFTLSIDEFMESDIYDRRAKQMAERLVRSKASSDQFRHFDERPEDLSQDGMWSMEDPVDKIDLWEIFLPRTQEIAVFFVDHESPPIYLDDHDGPERGPYTILGYSHVPENIKPLAPAELWEDLDDLVNTLFLKAADQASRSRTILASHNRMAGDVDKIAGTPDGNTVFTEHDPNAIREMRLGGLDPSLMAAIIQFKDLFSYQAGNLDALGGFKAQTETIGQDAMLRGSASERVQDMQVRTIKASSQIIRDIAWHLWEEDKISVPLTKQIAPEIHREITWTKNRKRGSLFDYNFDVVPYSLQARSPQERLQLINLIVQQVIMPNLQMLAQNGISFDFKKYLQTVSKLTDIEEINELLSDEMGRPLNERMSLEPPKSSPVSQRNYTRQSVPSENGQEKDAMRMLQQAAQSRENMQQGRGRPAGVR